MQNPRRKNCSFPAMKPHGCQATARRRSAAEFIRRRAKEQPLGSHKFGVPRNKMNLWLVSLSIFIILFCHNKKRSCNPTCKFLLGLWPLRWVWNWPHHFCACPALHAEAKTFGLSRWSYGSLGFSSEFLGSNHLGLWPRGLYLGLPSAGLSVLPDLGDSLRSLVGATAKDNGVEAIFVSTGFIFHCWNITDTNNMTHHTRINVSQIQVNLGNGQSRLHYFQPQLAASIKFSHSPEKIGEATALEASKDRDRSW